MDTATMLRENAYIDVKDFIAGNGTTTFTDDTVPSLSAEFGIDFTAGAMEFIDKYSGSSEFIHSLKKQLVRKGSLSLPQIRGALNVLASEIKKGRIDVVARGTESSSVAKTTEVAVGAQVAPVYVPDTTDPRLFECYTCGQKVRGWSNLVHHKDTEHLADVMDTNKAERSFLDISGLPDGRYAVMAPEGDARMYVFLQVKMLTRGSRRDRRFRYGKIVTGREYVPAGTIEVREWSGDTKRLCGMQRPGGGYEGEYIDLLPMIMQSPALFARMFALQKTRCSICGKSLTDDNSRIIGIGPECDKKYTSEYWKQFKRAAVAIGGLVKP